MGYRKFRKGGKRSTDLYYLQTIVLEGDLKNLCNPYRTKTILHELTNRGKITEEKKEETNE